MSLLPKRGVCFSCGHDHGNGFGSPDLLRVLKARGDEVAAYQAEIADLRTAMEAAQQQLAQRGDGELPKCDLEAALDTVYPIPESPHASVMNRAYNDRCAFERGWYAALAQRAGSVEVIGWYRDCQIDANEDSQNDLPPRYFDHRAIIASKTPPPGDGWKPLVDAAPPAAVQPDSGRDAALTSVQLDALSLAAATMEALKIGDCGPTLRTIIALAAQPSEQATNPSPKEPS